MRILDTNDWILLNSIIYKIYTTEHIDKMREQFLEQMKMLIDFDSADFLLASPDGENKLVSPVLFNCEEDMSSAYDEIDYSRGILYSGKTLIYRETDIIEDSKRVETDYYKKVYKVNKWHYSLQMVLAKKKEFDVIFLDSMMPGMSGEETMNAIKAECPLNANKPIIVLTAHAIKGAREEFLDAGFTDYISKPVDGEKLEEVLMQYLPNEKLEDRDNFC